MRPASLRPGPLHVLVMAKAPVPGTVKTRLCPPCTSREAAAIAEAALADTMEAVMGCGADAKVVALDGPPGPWLPAGVEVICQRGDGFDERLANAWGDLRSATGGWGVQIGMDTPQITAALLDDQLALLTCDSGLTSVSGLPANGGPPPGAPKAVLGGTPDGGWWLIGLPGTDPRLVFPGIPMSTPHTGAAQAGRLRSLGLAVAAAPELRDIDTAEDLRAVTASIPNSRVAAVARAVFARVDDPPASIGVGSEGVEP